MSERERDNWKETKKYLEGHLEGFSQGQKYAYKYALQQLEKELEGWVLIPEEDYKDYNKQQGGDTNGISES